MLGKKVSTTYLWIISLITGRFSKSRGKKKNAEKGAYGSGNLRCRRFGVKFLATFKRRKFWIEEIMFLAHPLQPRGKH